MRIHDFIRTPAVTCPSGTAMWQVAKLMEADNVGSVVVLGSDRRVAGIVTDRDLALRGLGNQLDSNTPIEEVMTPKVISIRADADIFDAATQMASSGCRRLPVLDADGNLMGIVALDDLTVLFAHQAENLAHAVGSATGPATST